MNKLLFALLFFVSILSSAQDGKISGVVTDKDYDDEPVAFASIQIKGTTKGAQSDIDGKFDINIAPGTYTLIVTFVGMQTVEVKDIEVRSGFTTQVPISMSAEAAALDDIIITVAKTRESEDALIEEKKKAVNIVQSIGAEELSKKGVSDAEGAVTKVSGISKQSGVKNVFVRGLGDRYNTTTLNGLPLPSDDPEYKNISLDFFGSDLLETVDINKVFRSDLSGDNAGANINIDLKGLSGKSALEIGLSSGGNSQTIGEDFQRIDGEGFFGFSNNNVPVNNLNIYSFENNLAPQTTDVGPNLGFSIAGGKRFNIGDNRLKVYGLVNFDNGFRFRDREVRNTNSNGTVFFDVDGQIYDYQTSQIAMVNLDYEFGDHNIELVSLYIHNNTQSFQEYEGISNPEQEGDRIFNRRQQTNNNNLWVNQILSNFKLTDRLDLKVSGSINTILSTEPDRRDFTYLLRDGFFSPDIDSGGNNQRYFSELDETDTTGKIEFTYNLNNDEDSDLLNELSISGQARFIDHTFRATIFNHTFFNRIPVDINNPDAIFNQSSLNSGLFRLETGRGQAINPNVFFPFIYDGNKLSFSGNVNYTKAFNEKFLISLGARFEMLDQEVLYNTNIATSFINGPSIIEETYFLPSLSAKYTLNEKSIIRLGASQTYMLPRFKEIAPFRYDGVNFAIQGNPDLQPSDIYNIDVAYEFYPKKGELISVTGFYKNIIDAVSRVEIPSAGNTLSYLNVGDATVFGVELEVRKDILTKEMPSIEPDGEVRESTLSFGFNASYINSEQQLDDPFAQFTESTTQLQGAAPILANVDLNYNTFIGKKNLNTAIVFNYFSDRVFSVGTRGFQNIIEKSVPTLDVVSSLTVGENSKISLKARNLFNPSIQLERDGTSNNVLLSSYKRGIDISVGYAYKF